MADLLCKTCKQCHFQEGNGNPSRFYCLAVRDTCSPHKLICKTARHSNEFSIKRTPKWCPKKDLNVTEKRINNDSNTELRMLTSSELHAVQGIPLKIAPEDKNKTFY